MTTKDSNGIELENGDSVQLTRDLKLKSPSQTLKKGFAIKNIKLTSNEEQIQCKIGKGTIFLKTCFLKKK